MANSSHVDLDCREPSFGLLLCSWKIHLRFQRAFVLLGRVFRADAISYSLCVRAFEPEHGRVLSCGSLGGFRLPIPPKADAEGISLPPHAVLAGHRRHSAEQAPILAS